VQPVAESEATNSAAEPEVLSQANENAALTEPAKPNAALKTETAKTSKRPATNTGSDDEEDPDVRVDGDTIYMGNVKIGPNGISPNVYIDRNGIKRPIPPPTSAVPFPGITKEQFEQMSPQQRQKLIDARRQLRLLERRRLNPKPSPPGDPE
jgi:hypothetical protein